MGLSPTGGHNGGGGILGGGYLRLLPLEHGCTVYCDQSHYGPVSDGRAEVRFKGDQAVVGSGRTGCGRGADGGSGGRTDGGWGTRRRVRIWRQIRIKSVGG